MMIKPKYKELTALDFQSRFRSESACRKYLVRMRWPKGFSCPHCHCSKGCYKPSRKTFECYGCKKLTSPTAGTLFHKSKVPLRKWFWAIYWMATSKKGVSALYLQKQLKLGSYNTAWMMAQKIRLAMADRDQLYKLKGIVEVDEIHIGGKQHLENRKKFGSNKSAFFIGVEEDRAGRPKYVSFQELESAYKLLPVANAVGQTVEKGSTLKSDGNQIYPIIAFEQDHVLEQSVRGTSKYISTPTDEHLQWVNIVTSNLKRWLISTHHGVFRGYRKEYLAEFAYRFNRRLWPEQLFDRLLFANIVKGPTPLRV